MVENLPSIPFLVNNTAEYIYRYITGNLYWYSVLVQQNRFWRETKQWWQPDGRWVPSVTLSDKMDYYFQLDQRLWQPKPVRKLTEGSPLPQKLTLHPSPVSKCEIQQNMGASHAKYKKWLWVFWVFFFHTSECFLTYMTDYFSSIVFCCIFGNIFYFC